MSAMAAMREVEHVRDRPCPLVERLIANPSETPVVFDETDDRRLIGQRVIDEVALRERRDQKQRQARTESTSRLIRTGS
jgi:hypothetical protein